MTPQHGEIKIGASVLCPDGSAGCVRQILVAPEAQQVIGLVIDRGLLRPDVVVPAHVVTTVSEDGVEIRLAQAELNRLPALQGHLDAGTVTEALRRTAHEASIVGVDQSSDHDVVVLHAAHPVHGTDGPVGRLERLLVALPLLDVTAIVIRPRRPFGGSLIIPAASIAGVDGAAIHLALDSVTLNRQPEYRSDRAVKSAVAHVLWQDPLIRFDANAIAISVTNGVVTLRGYVSNGRAVARTEELARTVRGVRRVEHVLIADAQLMYDVAQALARDERTRDPSIGFSIRHGVVVLFGEVSHPRVRSAAEEVVANVRHVRMVLNRISLPGVSAVEEDARVLLPRPGQNVFTTDGLFGRVERVVISPRTRRVTAMVVHGALPDPTGDQFLLDALRETRTVVLPMSMIDHVSPVEVFLRVEGRTAFDAPVFDPALYVAPDKAWDPPFPYAHADVLLDLYPGPASRTDLQPARSGWLDASSATAADGQWIARGYLVTFRDGQAGVVDHLLLDPATGTVSRFVVRAGLFLHKDTLIPAEWVRRVDDGCVYVDAAAEQLGALPAYQPPRSDAEVAADVNARLQTLPAVRAGQSPLEVKSTGGIIRLRGIVPSEADRTAAEAIARHTTGAWDVDNQLASYEQLAQQ